MNFDDRFSTKSKFIEGERIEKILVRKFSKSELKNFKDLEEI